MKDPFYDKITFEYMIKGNGNGEVYLADVMRFFECSIEKANEIKPKIEEIMRKLNGQQEVCPVQQGVYG